MGAGDGCIHRENVPDEHYYVTALLCTQTILILMRLYARFPLLAPTIANSDLDVDSP
jgi:hypothetical protein